VLRFCDRVADLAREGKLRNAPEEVAGVKLSADDLVALEVFLRALNENYECGADGCKVRRRADAGSGAVEGADFLSTDGRGYKRSVELCEARAWFVAMRDATHKVVSPGPASHEAGYVT
jgi:hypothetical protein